MTRNEIIAVLKRRGVSIVTRPILIRFITEMAGMTYGDDECYDAWLWFSLGWHRCELNDGRNAI